MAQHSATIPSSCVLCPNPDDGNMVTCSRCKIDYHLSCCNIEDDRGVTNWMCQKCHEQQQNIPHSFNVEEAADGTNTEHIHETSYFQQASVSGSHRTALTTNVRTGITIKKQLQLRQLEEEVALREEFLKRKYELLLADNAEEIRCADDNTQEPDVRPTENNIHSSAVTEQPYVSQCQQNESRSTEPNSSRATLETQTRPSNVNINQCHTNDFSSVNQPLYHSTQRLSLPQYSNASDVRRHQIGNGLNTPHATTHTNNSYLTDANVNNNTSDINISATQFFARQSFSKDLPHFNGDPREWPIFISAFEQSTNAAGYSNEENLIRLQKCLHGKARDAVRNCLMLPDMVPDIIRTLKMYFGRPECVLKSLIEDVRKMTLPKSKLEALIEFAFAIKNICATIRASKMDDYLVNPTLLQELVEKLSPDIMIQWALHSKDNHRPNLMDFSDWLYIIAEATCRVTVPVFESTYDKRTSRKESRLNTHSKYEDEHPLQQCFLCEEPHKVAQCLKFNEMSKTERWDVVKSKNLCCNCLGRHRRKCWFQRECGVNGCIVRHNPLLHNDEPPNVSTLSTLNNHKTSGAGDSFFRIVPVTLYNNRKSVTIFALMDDGSSLTLVEEDVADRLGVTGITEALCMRWTGDVVRFEDKSRKFDLKVSAKNSSSVYPLKNVHTVKNLNLSPETLLLSDIKRKYPYLVDIPLEEYENAVPSMIIGVNNPNLISSIKTREGKWHQPVASKTRLGWTLFGGSQMVEKLNLHSCVCTKDEKLHELVKQFFSGESDGITPSTSLPMSREDERAVRIITETCTFKDGQYEVGLLWKEDNPVLPNSLPTAIKRLNCIKQKTRRDSQIAEVLQKQIESLVEKGYAQKLPSNIMERDDDKVWYLPTFIVKNPHKPGKIRLVWDAAAKTENVSLNDFLLKGPDLLRPLMHVMFKFRMGAVAICGDIAEMFHRIRVREADAGAQRFLWWDRQNPVLIYQLNVLTFGASCSPFISHYVRNKNAETFGQNDPKVVEAITKQHYVDDFIDSTNSVKEAIELSLKVREVHARGGFIMRNWLSNSYEVLQALGEVRVDKNKSFEYNDNVNQYEKVLGLFWESKTDTFKINLKFVRIKRPIFAKEIIPTKREVLQVLMSVFDPLGFVTCFMAYLKSLLQHIWRSGIEWDEPLNDELYIKWRNWLTFLPLIKDVSIPRCYSLKLPNNSCKIELHTFVDASEEAYAAVSYFRIECDGDVELRLISAKSKVAPLRPLSIPRLELQAAVIGTRLVKTICAHDLKLQRRIMWTDSKTVLQWLSGDPRKYKQFVMFRTAEILKTTEIKEWRWVPSTMNVADFATKFRPPTEAYNDWFEGPKWLQNPESSWPVDNRIAEIDTSEIRPRHLFTHTRVAMVLNINFEYFSSSIKLQRAIGNWVLLIDLLQRKVKGIKERVTLSASHLLKAKSIAFKIAQMAFFMDEYFLLLHKNDVSNCGAFRNLNVYIDDNGVVRVKNRAQYGSNFCGLQRDLILLPAKHHLTKLIVTHYHLAYHHLNHETVLNEIRQIYFIIKLRVIYKVIRRNCQHCKISLAKPIAPLMAPVPAARLAAFQRPFTFVGVDYFGPISVKCGRKSLKRWGVLFTCLTIRAVHLEIAYTLSTD